jgi:hypothetical protein
MGKEMKVIAAGFLILFCAGCACCQNRIFCDYSPTYDSDNLSSHIGDVGYYYQKPTFLLGGKIGTRLYDDAPLQSSTHMAETGVFGKYTPGGSALSLSISQMWNTYFDPIIGAASWMYTPPDTSSFVKNIELSSERDIVESLPAIQQATLQTLGAAYVDFGLFNGLVATGGGYYQSISDGNRRTSLMGRLGYDLSTGLVLQAKVRSINGSQVSSAYFSPLHLQEYSVNFIFRRPVLKDTWVIRCLAGTGVQVIDNDMYKNIYAGELGMRGWIVDSYGVDASAGYTNFSHDSGNYGFFYGKVTLTFAF